MSRLDLIIPDNFVFTPLDILIRQGFKCAMV
jgi:hypothetical protein